MLLALCTTASFAAVTVAVPSQYPTIAAAMAAQPGLTDIILDGAGEYDLPYWDSSLSVSASVPDAKLTRYITNGGTLKLKNIGLTDVVAVKAASLSLTSVTVNGSRGAPEKVFEAGGSISATDVQIRDVQGTTLFAATGLLDLDRVSIKDSALSRAVYAGSTVRAKGLDVRCSTFDRIVDAEDHPSTFVTLDGVMVAETTVSQEYFAIGNGLLSHATIAGPGTAVRALESTGPGLTIVDTAFLFIDETSVGDIASASGITEWKVGHDDFQATEVLTHDDPLLAPGDCETGWWPMFGSPLVDVGVSVGDDHDESAPDVGATGGTNGLVLAPDADLDGVNASRDCDDDDPNVYTGKLGDVLGDGRDLNCDGHDGVDADRDGFASPASGGDDCADDSVFTFPGAEDAVGDGIDEDCDGIDGVDADADGYPAATSGGDDCDDTNPDAHPTAEEDRGGEDLDCDGEPSAGCGCGSSPPGGAVALLLALLALRRRPS